MEEFNPPAEGRKEVSKGFMNVITGSLGNKWKRDSREAAKYSPEMINQVSALLPQMSIYEWKILMYLLGPKELVKQGPFKIFGTRMPEWTPEMVLTYQVLSAGCTEVTDRKIRAVGGDFKKYSPSLKLA